MRKAFIPVLIGLFLLPQASSAVLNYQTFEDDNGTPLNLINPADGVQFGWGFNGAVVQRSTNGDPVHAGQHSWSVSLPKNYPLQAGTGIASQSQTFNMNFVPQCHDRLSFWIWSDPSEAGDHTVLVKFFDQGKYKDGGAGIWTRENQRARYQEWTRLEITFDRLPHDFDFEHIDKIEFFNYWDGTYFYDDIQVLSGGTAEQDFTCMREQHIIACPGMDQPSTMPEHCVSVFGDRGDYVLDLLKKRVEDKLNRKE
jgi:hypothetical protein